MTTTTTGNSIGGVDEEDEEDDDDEDPPEVRDPNMQPIPDHNRPDYSQENSRYLSTKRYVGTDKMRLDRFMELANIASTDLGDHTIVLSELYEIYS
jgi:hypothetical protein